jgi:hypothetical protein
MQSEASVLADLGYEVFIPKVIPAQSFRSGAVDYAFDRTLTIPAEELALLNAFDFYGSDWSDEIKHVVNARFAVAFVRPFTSRKLLQTLEHFEGHVALRAFGMDNFECYMRHIVGHCGYEVVGLIERRGKRFSFASGYKQIAAAEPAFLASRSIYLPIGMPKEFDRCRNSWHGSDRRFFTVLPDIKSSAAATATYEAFKRHFGHIPHVIAGSQSEPVDDPNVIGFVSHEELISLFQSCAAYFSPSQNLRHVLYTPVEAAIIGQPVVCYDGTLLAQLIGAGGSGCAASPAEAAAILERLVCGDRELSRQIIISQQALVDQFSEDFCKRIFGPALDRMLATVGSREKPARTRPQDLVCLLPEERYEPIGKGEWIEFNRLKLTVRGVYGLSWAEYFGRWSEADRVIIRFAGALPRKMRLILEGGAYGDNLKAPIVVNVGGAVAEFTFSSEPFEPETVAVDLELQERADCIEFIVPKPILLANIRRIGIAFKRMRIVDLAQPTISKRVVDRFRSLFGAALRSA